MAAKATIHITIPEGVSQEWLDDALTMWVDTIFDDDLYGALEASSPNEWNDTEIAPDIEATTGKG
jgi:hypothetical protein